MQLVRFQSQGTGGASQAQFRRRRIRLVAKPLLATVVLRRLSGQEGRDDVRSTQARSQIKIEGEHMCYRVKWELRTYQCGLVAVVDTCRDAEVLASCQSNQSNQSNAIAFSRGNVCILSAISILNVTQ